MFTKILKIVAIVLILAVIATVSVGIFQNKNKYVNVKLVKVSDIKVPADVDTEELFGLFLYNHDGTYVNSTNDISKLNYDKTKPLIIFLHGVQMGVGYKDNEDIFNYEGWLDAGYNVAEFFWSQFADDTPGATQDKVWGVNESMVYYYENDNGERVLGEGALNYSLAECFVAYYTDFLNRADFQGREIHITGLSMGANMTYAANNYLLTLEKAGKIPSSYLPDRVTFFDAYLDNIGNDRFYINWLDETVGANGTIGRAYQTVQMLKDRGIAVSYIASSPVEFTTTIGNGEKDLFDRMANVVTFMRYDASFAGLNIGSQHTSGTKWYYRMISQSVLYDQKDASAQEYALSPFMPISYTYARMGTAYTMGINNTEMVFSDDKITSNVENPKISGFAYLDANNNGVNDDRIQNRLNGIKVSLYSNSDVLIGTTTTANGGYYQFDLKASDIGNSYYIMIDLADTNFTVGKEDNGSFIGMGSGILATNKSQIFNINSVITLDIINIGLINKA